VRSGEALVCLKVKAVERVANVLPAPPKVFAVQAPVPSTEVSVELPVLVKKYLQFYQFGIVVPTNRLFGSKGLGCFYIVDVVVVNEPRGELWLYVAEKIDLFRFSFELVA